jgi:hypothetical protein
MKRIYFIFAFTCVLLVSCRYRDIVSIERQDLFSINIGRLEGEIDLINLESPQGRYKTAIAMRDGLFYISNGNGQKVSRYNSYGDLLFMVYNEETNPLPLTLKLRNDTELLTRWAITFPLDSPGAVAVDSRKHFYVEDILPDERHGFDPEHRILLDRTVLHFDTNGQFINYLGQEGIGGAPFPAIDSLRVSRDDEIVVICVLPGGRQIYWYDARGSLMYTVQFSLIDIPLPGDRRDLNITLEKIAASTDSRAVYIKADYYRPTFDESTKMQTGIEPAFCVVWEMSVETGAFTGRLDIPFYDYSARIHGQNITEKLLYSFLGVSNDKHMFFYVPMEDGYALLFMNMGDPGHQKKGRISVAADETQLNTFSISNEGILSALLADEYSAKLVWWRTDTILGDIK